MAKKRHKPKEIVPRQRCFARASHRGRDRCADPPLARARPTSHTAKTPMACGAAWSASSTRALPTYRYALREERNCAIGDSLAAFESLDPDDRVHSIKDRARHRELFSSQHTVRLRRYAQSRISQMRHPDNQLQRRDGQNNRGDRAG